MLPAIQAAREAARRSECSNKLKQLGVALHNYHDTFRVFPPGNLSRLSGALVGCTTTSMQQNVDTMAPWTVLILPFLEDSARYDTFNFRVSFDALIPDNIATAISGNRAAQSLPNSKFQCPSDPNSKPDAPNNNYFAVQGGGTTAGCTSSGQTSAWFYANGMFFHNSSTRMGDVLDGTTNTFMLGETRYQPFLTYYTSVYLATWASGLRTTTNNAIPQNLAAARNAINTGTGLSLNTMTSQFGSRHPGGCHFARGGRFRAFRQPGHFSGCVPDGGDHQRRVAHGRSQMIRPISTMTIVRVAATAILWLPLAFVGCQRGAGDGPARHPLSGKATHDGKPIPAGEIRFDPDSTQGNQGPGGVAEIVNGSYETRREFGVIGGPHVVRISGFDGQPNGELQPLGRPLFPEYELHADLPQKSGSIDFDVPRTTLRFGCEHPL